MVLSLLNIIPPMSPETDEHVDVPTQNTNRADSMKRSHPQKETTNKDLPATAQIKNVKKTAQPGKIKGEVQEKV